MNWIPDLLIRFTHQCSRMTNGKYNKINKMTFKPKKQLGQNFLADKKVLKKIIDKSEITEDDIVLEIGPGQGALTNELLKVARKVIAVEKDKRLFEYLKKKFEGAKNLELVNEDILEYLKILDIKDIGCYKIIGNIPYYLTSHLIRKIFELENKPTEIILMVQKEVAERMVAKAGEMSLLAISVQLFSEPEILFDVSRNSFWPKPKVDSAVIRLKVYKVIKYDIDEDEFFEIVKTGFSSKRKLLVNNLSDKLKIPKEKIYNVFKEIGLDKKGRAQDLSINEWVRILKLLNPNF